MAQPTWITPAGSIGVYSSFPSTTVSYQLIAGVNAPGITLTYKLQSGTLPPGFTIDSKSGIVSGTTSVTSVDVVYNFTVRATDDKGFVRDRTFSITISAASLPQFVTPSGLLLSTVDSIWISQQIPYTSPSSVIDFKVVSGELPPGLEISAAGLLQGYAKFVGYAKSYYFTLQLTGETGSTTRDYFISVTQNTSRVPTLLNTRPLTIQPDDTDIYYGYYVLPPVIPSVQANMGQFSYDDYFAFKMIGYDFDGLGLTYVLDSGQLPSGVSLDSTTGWLSGIPVQPSADVTGFIDDGTGAGTYTGVSGTTLTVTAVTSGKLNLGETIIGTGIASNTKVLSQLSATNTPAQSTTATGAIISNALNVTSSTNIVIGQFVSGTGVPSNTYVTSVNATTVTLSNNLTVTPTGTYDFYAPGLQGTYEVDVSQAAAPTTITAPIDAQEYTFAIRVDNSGGASSDVFNFKFIMNEGVNTDISWLTSSDLGQILNGSVSMLKVEATSDYAIQYRVISGSLPPNLTLREDGLIIGRVAFQPTNTALPKGQTTTFTFTVQAYNTGYQDIVTNTRTFVLKVLQEYEQPVENVYMKATPGFDDLDLLNSLFNLGSSSVTTVVSSDNSTNLFTCDSTAGLLAGSLVIFSGTSVGGVTLGVEYYVKSVVDSRRFSITTTENGSALNLTSSTGSMSVNTVAVPDSFIYRLNDPYFGKANQVVYQHAFGIYASDVDTYINSILINHYWRFITLGELKTAVARDESGNIIYEVVYSSIIDDLVNNDGISISKEIIWPQDIIIPSPTAWFTSLTNVYTSYEFIIDNLPTYYTSLAYNSTAEVHPNSLINMRKQLISNIPQLLDDRLLPLWMTSQQSNGSTLGFTPAWVIAYTKPGKSEILKKNIETLWPYKLNLINFKLDRFTVDKSATYNYNNIANPPAWQNLPSGTSVSKAINGVFPPNVITSPDELDNWYINMPIQFYGSTFGGLLNNTTYYVKSIDPGNRSFTVSKKLNEPTENFLTSSMGTMTAQPLYGQTTPIDSKDFYVFFPQRTILPGY